MYYKAKEMALTNGGEFHLAAFTKNGEIGVNSTRCSSKYKKRYKNSIDVHHELHAEASLILRCKSVPEKINVARFRSDGTPTMAKPCIHCQNFLKLSGVKRVRFTNWDGEWEEMRL